MGFHNSSFYLLSVMYSSSRLMLSLRCIEKRSSHQEDERLRGPPRGLWIDGGMANHFTHPASHGNVYNGNQRSCGRIWITIRSANPSKAVLRQTKMALWRRFTGPQWSSFSPPNIKSCWPVIRGCCFNLRCPDP